MELFVIRHGDAVDADHPNLRDEDRYLTPLGRDVTRRVARDCRGMGIGLFLTSPLVRSVQTAEICCLEQEGDPQVEILTSLSPGQMMSRLLEDVNRFSHEEKVAIVGHEPTLGHLVGVLLGRAPVPMKKSAVCLLRLDGEGRATFGWLQVPEQDRVTNL
jgi:phosphohistidine phosphatase